MRKLRTLASMAFGLMLLLLLAPLAWSQNPRVAIKAPTNTVAAYDSIYGVTATAYDTLGRRSPRSTVTWTKKGEAITIVPEAATHGQKATISAERPGIGIAIASWNRNGRQLLRDSVIITVQQARVVKVVPFYLAHLTPSGVVLDSLIPDTDPLPCAQVQALDRRAGTITGRRIQSIEISRDALTWISIPPDFHGCADTTVDPRLIAVRR